MADVTRRQFLRTATVSAAATGVVAVGGVGIVGALTGGAATETATGPDVADGTDVFARVTDARAGEITVYHGHKAVRFTNRDLAQQLLRAAE